MNNSFTVTFLSLDFETAANFEVKGETTFSNVQLDKYQRPKFYLAIWFCRERAIEKKGYR